VRILVFHGYLLHGTGSNVYNARLAEALVRAGHEVHLLSQERDPLSLDWVDAAGDWDGGALEVRERRSPVRATVYRPDIGGLLPVYVADRYEGVEARPFPELSDEEVDAYVERNVAAVAEVCAKAKPDVALANHLIMGPAILARALAGTGVPYAVKIHGSALEYTVKPHPRFLPYAREGLAGAAGIMAGSRHTAESLWAAMDDPGLPDRTRLGPPGVDVEEFRPLEPEEARRRLREFVAETGRASAGAGAAPAASEHAFARDAGEAGRALAGVDVERDRLVVFVGKLIASKGVELLLAAWPLVLRAHPDARLLVVGFGGWRAGLEALADALARGDLEAARAIRAEDGRELPELAAFLDGLEGDEREAYLAQARGVRDRVTWTGRLEHHELAEILPAADALVAPSTFPESFGMVAAEGAACGALPVVARHSGLAEVASALAERMPEEARGWLSFEVGPGAVRELASCLTGWLAADGALRARTREAIVAVTRERWSWDGVARTVISAAEGDLDGLPRP
jgi:glycosyltransferase involved in cell wall biosynthesis